MALCETHAFRSFPQLLNAPPTILTGPTRDKLKDFLDCIALFGRPEVNPSDQQLIDGCPLFAARIA
jgi:hypothetical protein